MTIMTRLWIQSRLVSNIDLRIRALHLCQRTFCTSPNRLVSMCAIPKAATILKRKSLILAHWTKVNFLIVLKTGKNRIYKINKGHKRAKCLSPTTGLSHSIFQIRTNTKSTSRILGRGLVRTRRFYPKNQAVSKTRGELTLLGLTGTRTKFKLAMSTL